jgi:cysteinyl-tRNA synthetase
LLSHADSALEGQKLMTIIKLHNSLNRKKELFVPLDPENVRMYLCGPTVYDRAHLGNARNVIMFDVLFRLFSRVYGLNKVTYVRNITDIDDKINHQVKSSGRDIGAITNETAKWYLEDMAALGNLDPTHTPRATQYIDEMIAMIAELIGKGHAYKAEGHVLFSVKSYVDYGRLSGRTVDDMIAGARVEIAPYKHDPMDFVLWKPSAPDIVGWDSPWGRGRPGWHIECSAMSYALLGPSFDIHGGGNDLQFPHHENEIAQSCCAYPDAGFANIWMHNEMLQVEGKKMSKSLGNFFTLRDLLDEGYSGEVIRFVFLSTHYSKPMDWTEVKALEAEKILRKWRAITDSVSTSDEVSQVVLNAVADDLNTVGAMVELHAIAKRGDADQLKASASLLGLLSDGMGHWARAVDLSYWKNKLLEARQTALQSKDFSKVDRLKSVYVSAGLDVRMSKAGVELVPTAGFDIGRLDGME